MRVEGTAVFSGGGFNGTHVPLPTTPRRNGQRPPRQPVIVLQPLTRSEERALERRAAGNVARSVNHAGGPANPVTQEEARAFAEAYQAGDTIKSISERHQRAKVTVREHLTRQGLTIRTPHGRINNSGIKITNAEREQIIADYQAGGTVLQISRTTRRGHATVLKVLKQAGVTMRPVGGVTKHLDTDEQRRVADTYQRVKSIAATIAETGYSAPVITRALDAQGIAHSYADRHRPGDLTDTERDRIRQLAADGMTVRAIATTVGRARQTVTKVLRETR